VKKRGLVKHDPTMSITAEEIAPKSERDRALEPVELRRFFRCDRPQAQVVVVRSFLRHVAAGTDDEVRHAQGFADMSQRRRFHFHDVGMEQAAQRIDAGLGDAEQVRRGDDPATCGYLVCRAIGSDLRSLVAGDGSVREGEQGGGR